MERSYLQSSRHVHGRETHDLNRVTNLSLMPLVDVSFSQRLKKKTGYAAQLARKKKRESNRIDERSTVWVPTSSSL